MLRRLLHCTRAGAAITGMVVLGVVAAGISWWQMDPATRQSIMAGTGKILAWAVGVLVAPWATFFLSTRTAKFDSNLAGGLLVFAYTAVEVVVLAWLFNWSISGAAGWTFVGVGGLLAAAYNLFTCDWIAEKLG